jgi:hypothetical protein
LETYITDADTALGVESEEYEQGLNWCFRVPETGEIEVRGPFRLDSEDLQILDKGEIPDYDPLDLGPGRWAFHSHLGDRVQSLTELTDDEFKYICFDKVAEPHEIIITREHKVITDIVSAATNASGNPFLSSEDKSPFYIPQKGNGPWTLISGRRDFFVDLRLSTLNLTNRIVEESGGESWPEIVRVFLNGIGIEISRSRNEEDGRLAYMQGSCLLPDAINVLRKRKYFSILQKSCDLPVEGCVSELSKTIANVICELKPELLSKPLGAPFVFEAPFFEIEEDPRTAMMHHITAATAGSLETRVEKAVEERVLTWLQSMKWFNDDYNENQTDEDEPLVSDATLFDCDLRQYVERCELGWEGTCGYYLRTIEEEANRWLDGLLGDAIRVSISCRNQFEDGFVSIAVKDFGDKQEYPYENSSSGARRWIDIAVSIAIDKFSDFNPIIRREDIKVFSDTVDDETGYSGCLSVFWMLEDGDLEMLENSVTINQASRFRHHQELTRKPLAIIDEPELHMHHGMQKRLSKALETLSGEMKLMMASHSVEFLSMDPKHIRFMNLKSINGRPELSAIEGSDLKAVKEIARDLGATSGQLFQMTSAFLVLEGKQDEMVIRKLCGSRLARDGIWLMSMDGILAQNSLKSVIRMIAAHMDVPVGIMYDNVRQEISNDLNDPERSREILRLDAAGLRRRYEEITGEEKALVKLFKSLSREVRPISLGIPVRDITLYLSDRHLRGVANMPGFPGLEVVAGAFEEFRKKEIETNRKTGKKELTGIKEFCKKEYRLDISAVLDDVLDRMKSDGTTIPDIERRLDILAEAAEEQSLLMI